MIAGDSVEPARNEPEAPRVLRRAAKVLLIDEQQRVLLFRGGDPGTDSTESWWFPPGGGVDKGESIEEAARREVFEETGLQVGDPGPVRFHRVTDITFNGAELRLDEDYFLVHVEHFDIDDSGWTDLECQAMHEDRWWRVDELRVTNDTVFPEGLADRIAELL